MILEPTLARVDRALRSVPMGYVGQTRVWATASEITKRFGVPYEDAYTIVDEGGGPDAVKDAIVAWRASAQPRDLLIGHMDALMFQTERDDDASCGDVSWGADMAKAVLCDFLLPEAETLEAFHARRENGGRWARKVAEDLADRVLNGPRLAAFVFATTASGKVAATTRPDKGNGPGLGLPGGKLEPGETAADAAMREAAEEGWQISDILYPPFHVEEIRGFRCAWYEAVESAVMLEDFKEKGRITPVEADYADLMTPGLGNDNALRKILDRIEVLRLERDAERSDGI